MATTNSYLDLSRKLSPSSQSLASSLPKIGSVQTKKAQPSYIGQNNNPQATLPASEPISTNPLWDSFKYLRDDWGEQKASRDNAIKAEEETSDPVTINTRTTSPANVINLDIESKPEPTRTGTLLSGLFGSGTTAPVEKGRVGYGDAQGKNPSFWTSPDDPDYDKVSNPLDKGLLDILAANTTLGNLRRNSAEDTAEYAYNINGKDYSLEDLDGMDAVYNLVDGNSIKASQLEQINNGLYDIDDTGNVVLLDGSRVNPQSLQDSAFSENDVQSLILPDGNTMTLEDYNDLSTTEPEQTNKGFLGMKAVDPVAPWEDPGQTLGWLTDMAANSAPYFVPGYNVLSAASRSVPAMKGFDSDSFDPETYTFADRQMSKSQQAGQLLSPIADYGMERFGVAPGLKIKPSNSYLKTVGKIGTQEGLEEVLPSILEQLGQDGLLNYGMDRDINNEFIPTSGWGRFGNMLGNAAQGFGEGAIFGGLLGAGRAAPGAVRNYKDHGTTAPQKPGTPDLDWMEEYKKRNGED